MYIQCVVRILQVVYVVDVRASVTCAALWACATQPEGDIGGLASEAVQGNRRDRAPGHHDGIGHVGNPSLS